MIKDSKAGELEAKGLYRRAAVICVDVLTDVNKITLE